MWWRGAPPSHFRRKFYAHALHLVCCKSLYSILDDAKLQEETDYWEERRAEGDEGGLAWLVVPGPPHTKHQGG